MEDPRQHDQAAIEEDLWPDLEEISGIPRPEERCETCDGEGLLNEPGYPDCADCKGTGRADRRDD